MTLKIPANSNSTATVYVPAKAASDVTVNGEAVTIPMIKEFKTFQDKGTNMNKSLPPECEEFNAADRRPVFVCCLMF